MCRGKTETSVFWPTLPQSFLFYGGFFGGCWFFNFFFFLNVIQESLVKFLTVTLSPVRISSKQAQRPAPIYSAHFQCEPSACVTKTPSCPPPHPPRTPSCPPPPPPGRGRGPAHPPTLTRGPAHAHPEVFRCRLQPKCAHLPGLR